MIANRKVVDTSAWIDWLAGGHISESIGAHLPDMSEWIVPTIVQLELAKWLLRELGEVRADRVIAFTRKCVVVPLDTSIALMAADLHREYRLATADAIVYATARLHHAGLLTCDAHFKGMPEVIHLGKSRHDVGDCAGSG